MFVMMAELYQVKSDCGDVSEHFCRNRAKISHLQYGSGPRPLWKKSNNITREQEREWQEPELSHLRAGARAHRGRSTTACDPTTWQRSGHCVTEEGSEGWGTRQAPGPQRQRSGPPHSQSAPSGRAGHRHGGAAAFPAPEHLSYTAVSVGNVPQTHR